MHQKTSVSGLSCGVISVILCLAVLTHNTVVCRTDRLTDTTLANTALAQRRAARIEELLWLFITCIFNFLLFSYVCHFVATRFLVNEVTIVFISSVV